MPRTATKLIRLAAAMLVICVLVGFFLWSATSSRNAVIRQSQECGVDLHDAIIDVELLGEYSTALGNSGHWTHRVTIRPDKLDIVLAQMNIQNGDNNVRAPIVDGMDLTINCREAKHWDFADTGNGGILMLVDPEQCALEIVSYW